MSDSAGRDNDFDTEFGDDLVRPAERLRDARPTPSLPFTAALRSSFDAPSPSAVDRPRTRVLIVSFGGAGALLLAVGALVTFL